MLNVSIKSLCHPDHPPWEVVQPRHEENPDDDGKVGEEVADPGWEEAGKPELLEADAHEEGAEEEEEGHEEHVGAVLAARAQQHAVSLQAVHSTQVQGLCSIS